MPTSFSVPLRGSSQASEPSYSFDSKASVKEVMGQLGGKSGPEVGLLPTSSVPHFGELHSLFVSSPAVKRVCWKHCLLEKARRDLENN